MDDDADLMSRVARGEKDAFRALVVRHEKAAYNFFLRLTKNPEDAEDLTQELFVALFRAARRYRAGASFRAYLYRIAANMGLSHLRKGRLRAALSIDAMIDSGFDVPSRRREDDPAASFDSRETWRRYEAALSSLPRPWRIALELRVARELSYEEIAAAMGKSVASVESMLFRARERIADELGGSDEGKGDA
ncbi:MAG: sigma-70 family RNA polymerase sigma factor [Candidatus Krumholzibacteria bacterium]|nr:sigma-70 family RNA polymerase sigma factor [Candidatus Krumholzibacteria bacterium]